MNRALLAAINDDREALGLQPLTAEGWNPTKQWRAKKGEEGAGRFIEMPDIKAKLPTGKAKGSSKPAKPVQPKQEAPEPSSGAPKSHASTPKSAKKAPTKEEPKKPESETEDFAPVGTHLVPAEEMQRSRSFDEEPSGKEAQVIAGDELEGMLIDRGMDPKIAAKRAAEGQVQTRDGKGLVYSRYEWADSEAYKQAFVDHAAFSQEFAELDAKRREVFNRDLPQIAQEESKNAQEYVDKLQELKDNWDEDNDYWELQEELDESEANLQRMRDAGGDEEISEESQRYAGYALDAWDKIAPRIPEVYKDAGRDRVLINPLTSESVPYERGDNNWDKTLGWVRGVGNPEVNIVMDRLETINDRAPSQPVANSARAKGDMLTYTLAHELGHVLDRPQRSRKWEEGEFYESSSNHMDLYEDLEASGDGGSYAEKNHKEAFAEMFVDFIMGQGMLSPEERTEMMQAYINRFGWEMTPDEFLAQVKQWKRKKKEDFVPVFTTRQTSTLRT